MQRQSLRLAIISDRPNQGIAKTYFSLLQKEGSAYAECQCSAMEYDLGNPAKATDALERQHAVLAHIGVPGRRDYPEALYGFMDAYLAVKRKPVLGLVTHDARHTRYMVERWPALQKLPDGALSIVDASRALSLRSGAVAAALDLLLRNRPGAELTIPFTEVRPQSIIPAHETDLIQAV